MALDDLSDAWNELIERAGTVIYILIRNDETKAAHYLSRQVGAVEQLLLKYGLIELPREEEGREKE